MEDDLDGGLKITLHLMHIFANFLAHCGHSKQWFNRALAPTSAGHDAQARPRCSPRARLLLLVEALSELHKKQMEHGIGIISAVQR